VDQGRDGAKPERSQSGALSRRRTQRAPVRTLADVYSILTNYKAGDRIDVEFLREGHEPMQATVVLQAPEG